MQLTQDDLIDVSILSLGEGGTLGVAVSGGSDSLALLHLLNERHTGQLAVVTIDHGLRDESAAEAAQVGSIACKLGLNHEVLEWHDKPDRGNLQDLARRARKRLLADWARRRGVSAVVLGHTADDQAETFLMRLARGSGLQGLAAMDPITQEAGCIWLRPMLGTRRAALRSYLMKKGIAWVDDPSNQDTKFDRIKMRKAIKTLNDAGIEVPQIAKTTARLRSAKQVLFTSARDLGHTIGGITPLGEIVLDWERLCTAQQAIRLRVLSEAIRTVAGSYYAPRAYAVEALFADDVAARTTLNGCIIIRDDAGQLTIRREPAAIGGPVSLGKLWDDRWIVSGTDQNVEVAALGANGLAARPNWRESGFAREALMSTPGIWQDENLVCAPLLENRDEFGANLHIGNPFFTAIG